GAAIRSRLDGRHGSRGGDRHRSGRPSRDSDKPPGDDMKMLPTRRRAAALLAGLGAAALAATSFGTAFAGATDKPLRVILPVGPGSGVDTIVRAAGPSLTKALGGQPVVIENLPGAGGTIGTLALIKAPADGRTIGVVSNNHVVNPAVFKKMPFDAIADITPISV